MVILKENNNHNETKIDKNSSLEDIFKILNNSKTAQDWIDLIQENLDFFISEKFKSKLIEELKIQKDKEKISMILFILSFIQKINNNSDNTNNKIAIIVKKYQTKLNDIILEKNSIKQQKKWVESGNKKLLSKLSSKEEQLNSLTKILNSFWIETNQELQNKLKNSEKLVNIFEILESDWTFKKWDDIVEIVNRLNKSHTALEKFINILVKQWILLRVANSTKLPKINNTALNAVKKTKIYDTNNINIESELNFLNSNSQIIAWENTQNIKKFQLKEFKQSEEVAEQESDKNEEINSEDVKLMMDRIYELEQKAKQDSKKIKQLEKKSLKQKEKYKQLEKKNQKKLDEKEKEIQARIIEAIANSHSKKS